MQNTMFEGRGAGDGEWLLWRKKKVQRGEKWGGNVVKDGGRPDRNAQFTPLDQFLVLRRRMPGPSTYLRCNFGLNFLEQLSIAIVVLTSVHFSTHCTDVHKVSCIYVNCLSKKS